MQSIHTEIVINAPADHIWQGLMISPAIPPEIREAIRERKVGCPLKVPMSSGGRSVTLTVLLLTAEPPREIRWKGHLWVPGLFDGEHRFIIREETGGKNLLIQSERFSGLLVPLFSRTLVETKKQFESVNAVIKDLAEQKSA